MDGDLRIKLVLDGGGEGDHLHGALAKLVEGGVCGDVAVVLVGGLGEAGDLVEKLLGCHDANSFFYVRRCAADMDGWLRGV